MRRAWVRWPREAFESMDEGPEDADEAPADEAPAVEAAADEAPAVEAATVEEAAVEAATVEAATVEAATVEAATVEAATVVAATAEAATAEAATVEAPVLKDKAPAVQSPAVDRADSPRLHIAVRTRDARPTPAPHSSDVELEVDRPTDPAAGEARAATAERMCWLCALTRGEDGWVTPCCGSTSAHRECYDRMVDGGISCVLCPQNKSLTKTPDCQCRVA
jgi:hypothetical protein